MVSNSPSRMAIILLDFPGVDFTSQPKRARIGPLRERAYHFRGYIAMLDCEELIFFQGIMGDFARWRSCNSPSDLAISGAFLAS